MQVLVPLLANEQNHVGWPSVVTADVLKHVNDLKDSVHVLAGQVSSRYCISCNFGARTY